MMHESLVLTKLRDTVDCNAIGQLAFDQLRTETKFDPTNDQLARSPFCHTIAPIVTAKLNQQFTQNALAMTAYTETHRYMGMWHCYSVVSSLQNPTEPAVVLDTTYKQFIPPELQDIPPVLVESRAAAAAFMARMVTPGMSDICAELYAVDTYWPEHSESLAREHNTPIPILVP